MTLNGVLALILRYFTEFVHNVVVKQLLDLPRFQNLLLIVYAYPTGILSMNPPMAVEFSCSQTDRQRAIKQYVLPPVAVAVQGRSSGSDEPQPLPRHASHQNRHL